MARRPNQPALYELIRDRAMLVLPGAAGRGAGAPAGGGAPGAAPAGPGAASNGPSPATTNAPTAPAASATPVVAPRAPHVDRPSATAPAQPSTRPMAQPSTRPVAQPARPATGAFASPGATPSGPPLRVLRVPIGFVWIAAGAALLIAVIAYVAGFNHASAREAGRRASSIDRAVDGSGGAGPAIADPLAAQPEAGRGGTRGAKPEETAPKPADKGPARARSGDAASGGGGNAAPTASADPRQADPRQKGWYYFVVAHPSISRAGEMVQFLRDNGLDAHVVRDHNGDLRKVIVLPGFAKQEDRSSPQVKAFRAKLLEVGLKWEKAARNNQNFGQAYAEPYTG